jgi:hypothetical protein
VAFNGDAIRDLASQFLVLAEKQGAKVPSALTVLTLRMRAHAREKTLKNLV